MQATIHQTQTLFQQGYRVRAGREVDELVIRKPDGTRYTVQPLRNCCNCPAGQNGRACKHLKQLPSLVLEQWAQALPNATRRYEDEMYRLMLAWDRIREARSHSMTA